MSLSETNWRFLLIGRIGNIVIPDRTYLFYLFILIRTIPEHFKIYFFDVEYIYGFVGWGSLQTKSMTSQRNRAVKDGGYVLLWQRYDNNKMADKCY